MVSLDEAVLGETLFTQPPLLSSILTRFPQIAAGRTPHLCRPEQLQPGAELDFFARGGTGGANVVFMGPHTNKENYCLFNMSPMKHTFLTIFITHIHLSLSVTLTL